MSTDPLSRLPAAAASSGKASWLSGVGSLLGGLAAVGTLALTVVGTYIYKEGGKTPAAATAAHDL